MPDDTAQTNGRPFVIPALHNWKAAKGTYTLDIGVVCNDSALYSIGEMLMKYLIAMNLGYGEPVVDTSRKTCKGDILLQLVRQKNQGEEGYELRVTPRGIEAMAQMSRGIMWAVQTIVQMSKDGKLPCGHVYTSVRTNTIIRSRRQGRSSVSSPTTTSD